MSTGETLVCYLEDINTYYGNLLRRTMLSKIPTLAIDSVTFSVNTSLLHDELIAHRLGLVVLDSRILIEGENSADLSDSDNSSEKLNDNIEDISVNLDVTCEQDFMYVTAEMLKISHEKVTAVHLDTIIAMLRMGERIKLTASLKVGVGSEHGKWNPVSVVKYDLHQLCSKNEKNEVTSIKYKIVLGIETTGALPGRYILDLAQQIIEDERGEKQPGRLNKFKERFLTPTHTPKVVIVE